MSIAIRVFLFRFIMAFIVIAVTIYLTHLGYSFYQTPIEERFYHPAYHQLGASGILGQGLGIVGTLIIAFGVWGYIYAKKTLRFEKYVRLKYLLEFHIFLCTLGPIMVLFHTTFKFGGLISVGFWSMVVVVLSGIVGRYIYIQIPRTLSGKALSYEEIQNELSRSLMEIRRLMVSTGKDVSLLSADLKGVRAEDSIVFDGLKNQIRQAEIGGKPKREALKILRKMQITRFRMQRLDKMQRLFSYWHIFHKPFAIIMMVIVIVHIAVTLAMGYTWIF
jgi:hypothetical protein